MQIFLLSDIKNNFYQFKLDHDDKEINNDKEVMICNSQIEMFKKVEQAKTEITYKCVQRI